MANPSSPVFVDFRAVKAAVTMEQVLAHYGLTEHLKRSGDSLSGHCPIHQGSNPTQFRVNTVKNVWNCFGDCNGGGNVLDFVCRIENVPVREAAIKLSEWFNLPANRNERRVPPARTTRSTTPPPSRPASKAVANDGEPEVNHRESNKPLGFSLTELTVDHPYLTERGLSPETIEVFGLGRLGC